MASSAAPSPASYPARVQPAVICNLIDGCFRPARGGATTLAQNPATGQTIATVPDSTAHDVNEAVAAAERAFPAWSVRPARERAELLRRLAALVERDLDAFALAESENTGKPLALARSLDVPRAIANLRHFADAVIEDQPQMFEQDLPRGVMRSTVLRKPLGVAACISPWNLPLYLFTWKIAPALAAGCTVVGKPSEVTPITAWMLSQLMVDAGFPAGVCNVVHGRGPLAGAALAAHPDVACITFTGGTLTGQSIARAAAGSFKRTALELGGKNAAIVCADAANDEHLSATTAGLVRAMFTNQGQVCHCASRILIERSCWNRLVPALVERTRAMRIGDPLDAATDLGSLISAPHLMRVAGMVNAAVEGGAQLLCGGARVPPDALPERVRNGAFFPPTLLQDVPPEADANQEEIFGPVATLIPYSTDADAVRIANGTKYGLSATVWTPNAERATHIASALSAGTVWINGWMMRDLRVPIGGVRCSGIGREGGQEALHFFAEPMVVVRSTGD